MVQQGGAVRKGTVYRTLNRRLSLWRTFPLPELTPIADLAALAYDSAPYRSRPEMRDNGAYGDVRASSCQLFVEQVSHGLLQAHID